MSYLSFIIQDIKSPVNTFFENIYLFFGGLFMTSFADRLKELRREKGVTQKQMAELLCLKNDRTYRQYEAGNIDPPTSKTEILADYFGVSVDYLLGRTNYSQDADGTIKVKVPPDIMNLNTDDPGHE